MNAPLGYAWIHQHLRANLPPPAKPASISNSVKSQIDTGSERLFPRNVALENSLPGHLEFALRHEDMDLALLATALTTLPAEDVASRVRKSPNGEYVRKLAYWWEWFRQEALDAPSPSVTYVPLLDPRTNVVVANPKKAPKYRVLENQLGNRDFCPVARLPKGLSGESLLRELTQQVQALLNAGDGAHDLYERALGYIYLSETRSSFEIEREQPTASKERAFVSLLGKVNESRDLDEDWLVELQHLGVRDAFSHDMSFRTKQNWLDRDGRNVDFFPPAPEHVRALMDGLLSFANDRERSIDPIAKAAIVSFGFVYIHPFCDGNGRLHRFLLHHTLAQSGLLPDKLVIPVSAVLSKNLRRYWETLTAFSKPVTSLWDYRRADADPLVVSHPGKAPYAYWNASGVIDLVRWALTEAVQVEVPTEVRYLKVYDASRSAVDREFDLPAKDLNVLVRCAIEQGGNLSLNRRKQFFHLPTEVFDRIESIVTQQLAEHPAPAASTEA